MNELTVAAPNLSRRGFLRGMAGILAAGIAPAIITSKALMPIRAPLPKAFAAWQISEANESGVMTATFRVTITRALEVCDKAMGDAWREPEVGKWFTSDGSVIQIADHG